jgi:hypothetical protein
MPELTPEMHEAMAHAMARARRSLIAAYPSDGIGENLLCCMIAAGFTDMLRTGEPLAQHALADVSNDRLAGSGWQITRQVH